MRILIVSDAWHPQVNGVVTSLQALIDEEMRRPFDTATAPLLRVAVVTLPGERHRVLMSAHAAICDGWSLDVLIEELAQAYGLHLSTGSVLPRWRRWRQISKPVISGSITSMAAALKSSFAAAMSASTPLPTSVTS